jgi:DNA mismatch repair protein MSH6
VDDAEVKAASKKEEEDASFSADDGEDSPAESPVKKRKPAKKPSSSGGSFLKNRANDKSSASSPRAAPADDNSDGVSGGEVQIRLHDTLKFLQPDHIMDANKRKPDDPKYDHRTLHVPAEFLTSKVKVRRCCPGCCCFLF